MASVTTEQGEGPLQKGASTLLTPKGSPPKSTSSSSTTSTVKPGDKSETIQVQRPEFEWMVKPCFMYKEEYKDCKSFKARFHQYFVDGKTHECQHWKEDYDNCTLWEDKGDVEALKKVVNSEKLRVRKRLRDHYANNVWERRESPPADWNKPLPPSIQKDYQNSYLQQKADELKNGTEKLGFASSYYRSPSEGLGEREFSRGSSCSIM